MKPVSIEKSQQRIGHMFNRIAPTYDFLNHFLSAGMDLLWRRQAVRALRLEPHQQVLDVASGTGDLAFAALRNEPALHVIGADLALEMLNRAECKRNRFRIAKERYSTIAGDALRLPFRSAQFDAVMIAYGIRNVPDMDMAFQEFHRVLKTGGRVMIQEFSLPTQPLFRDLYLFYFQKMLPTVGNWISQDQEAYDYLPASVGAFLEPEQIVERLRDHDFAVDCVRRLLGGVTYFITARKR